MKRTKLRPIFLLSLLLIFPLIADPSHISGRIVNNRGGSERCGNLRIKIYLNSIFKTYLYTDESGVFSFDITKLADNNATPEKFELDQNYPNPFNKNTTLPYSIDMAGAVSLDIYDIRGRKIRALVRDYQEQGRYLAIWNGKNDLDQYCPQGIYFYVLKMNGKTDIRKMSFMSNRIISSIGSTPVLAKSQSEQILELRIGGSDIENKTITQSYTQLPSSIELGNIPVHVYPHLRTTPDSLKVLEGFNVSDTLDIYFEHAFSISSTDLDLDWEFNPDSTVSIHYKNVTKSSVTLRINETGETHSDYSRINFALDQRAVIWPKKLRRAYLNIPYSQNIITEDAQGDVTLTLKNTLPAGFSFNGTTLSGSTTTGSESMLYFDLVDDRQIVMNDSALLIVSHPDDVSFNDYVINVLEEYHCDGRYPYSWVSGYKGVTRDLYYNKTKIANANPDSSHSTYCCGLTFEIYFRSIKRLNQDLGREESINGMSASDFSHFISMWFVQNTLGDGPGIALDQYGLGDKIPDMKDVTKGDFVQIWRTGGSGHSVIFINWVINTAGDTTGMRYWSTQTSTNGANYNTEYFSGYGGSIDKTHTFYSRGHKPEDFEPF